MLRAALGSWALAGAVVGAPMGARAEFTLDAVRAEVSRGFPNVSHMTGDALERLLTDPQSVLIIDAREEAEFAVSRIPHAHRVNPSVSRAQFLDRFQDIARGRQVVFYCSVGVRSSRLAVRLQDALRQSGARAVHNLDGGVFAWHRERRLLIDDRGATRFVHPFNVRWGRLVDESDLARTTPRPPVAGRP